MIAFVRTAGIAPGKTGEMMAFAKEVAGYNNKLLGVELTVLGHKSWLIVMRRL